MSDDWDDEVRIASYKEYMLTKPIYFSPLLILAAPAVEIGAMMRTRPRASAAKLKAMVLEGAVVKAAATKEEIEMCSEGSAEAEEEELEVIEEEIEMEGASTVDVAREKGTSAVEKAASAVDKAAPAGDKAASVVEKAASAVGCTKTRMVSKPFGRHVKFWVMVI